MDAARDREMHWDTVYRTKASDAVSWYEDVPAVSLDLIDRAGFTGGT